MASKTITVTEDAYRLLKRQKRPGESFSELIRRTFGGGSLEGLIGLLTEEEGEILQQRIAARRKREARLRIERSERAK